MLSATRSLVLVVEDDRDSREALVRLLRHKGYTVVAAATATAGIAEIIQKQPDRLVLDLMLPDVNGVEVLRVIRQSSWPIRVAVVTATHEPRSFPGLMALRPDVIFAKPLDFGALNDWLAESG